MTTRSEQLRKRDRKVLAWALFIAVAIHVAVFILMPAVRAGGKEGLGEKTAAKNPDAGVPLKAVVSVVFGPPTITVGDSTEVTQPSDRTLHTSRIVALPAKCSSLVDGIQGPLLARFRLRIPKTHEAKDVRLVETSGNACADDILVQLTRDLAYHWLPDERFPAPVALVQPAALLGVEY